MIKLLSGDKMYLGAGINEKHFFFKITFMDFVTVKNRLPVFCEFTKSISQFTV